MQKTLCTGLVLKYYEYLLRAAESMLSPFGYTEERLDGMMRRKMQRSLCG